METGLPDGSLLDESGMLYQPEITGVEAHAGNSLEQAEECKSKRWHIKFAGYVR